MRDNQRYEEFKRYVVSTMYPGEWWADVVRKLPEWRVHEIYKKHLDDLREIYRKYKETR
jgi:hypothetical protein